MDLKRIAPYMLLAGVFVGAGYVCLHGARLPVLDPQGPVALGERDVIIVTTLLSSIIVVPVFALLFWFAWKYRASDPENMKHHSPEWDHSNPLFEFAWWLVPSAIIAVLSVVAWQSSHALDPYAPLSGVGSPMTIEVVALDWKWLFIYPEEGIATVNEVVIPVGSPVRFVLTADAPMNSFWIPSLAGQIMVMPGMTTQLNVLASSAGEYEGVSGNMSGPGFAGMSFKARAVALGEYAAWVDSVRKTSSPLSRATYDSLAKPSENVAAMTYSPIDQDLYTAITMRYMKGSFIPERMPEPSSTTFSPTSTTSAPSTVMPDMSMGIPTLR